MLIRDVIKHLSERDHNEDILVFFWTKDYAPQLSDEDWHQVLVRATDNYTPVIQAGSALLDSAIEDYKNNPQIL